MIRSLLIANRGEIACRIIRTARKLGVETVAVYSDADANALHVKMADNAVHIGPSPAAESYLRGETIIAAAKETGAEAIHPGYGFLSENADFAEAVIKAGLIWVGPKPDSIRAMGLKDAAKKLMQAAGVPTTPGYLGDDQSPQTLAKEAEKIGFPVLIKAVAGGGGKGMRKVNAPDEFADALASCQREAKASFGDDKVLLEKWITGPRHIEVQVFGDTHANTVHLFERDCTLQRRHQKVIEEAPAPGMDEATREAVCAAAVRAAEAVNYVGAGTVEFIADGSEGLRADRIWFMEMNTRLQVEHPVTEEITGVDLVEWQLRVASGEPLPKRQDELSINGWAMEARLYAENPETGFLPSTGTLEAFELSDVIRTDSGVTQGGEVSPFYDPMIAKLISTGETRGEAIDALASACDTVLTWPVRNNAGFLAGLLRRNEFREATVTTGFIGEHLDAVTTRPSPAPGTLATVARVLAEPVETTVPDTPWHRLPGFRLSAPADLETRLEVDGAGVTIDLGDTSTDTHALLQPVSDGHVLVEAGWAYAVSLPRTRTAGAADAVSDGAVRAPMPGKVVSVAVKDGAQVASGDKLMVIEAMKMEHTLTAPMDGKVTGLTAQAGAQVAEGVKLMEIVGVEGS